MTSDPLESLLLESKQQKTLVLVSSSSEVQITECYWKPFLDMHGLNVTFLAPDALNNQSPCDHLIVCGWLNQKRMRRLMEGVTAGRTTILLYPFEETWSQRAVRCWNITSIQDMSDQDKAALLASGEAIVIQSIPDSDHSNPEEGHIEADVADIAEFETRLGQHQWGALLRSGRVDHEDTIRAVCVRFSSGYYAFLTDSYKVPVVTDFLVGTAGQEQKISQKQCKELHEGDYIVFREGAQSDVLRELADKALWKAGRGALRSAANLWKGALRRFVGITGDQTYASMNAQRFSILISQLREAGVETSEGTVRWWLLGDSTIGPHPMNYLNGIAKATGDSELQSRLDEVQDAIRQVRGAHLQAARYLAGRLLASLPAYLATASIESSPRLDLGEDGCVIVVRVEEIAEKPVEAAWSRVNYLLDESMLPGPLPMGAF